MKTQTNTLVGVSTAAENSQKRLIFKKIIFEKDVEIWTEIVKGLNILNCMSATEIASEGLQNNDATAYAFAAEFIQELNSAIYEKIFG